MKLSEVEIRMWRPVLDWLESGVFREATGMEFSMGTGLMTRSGGMEFSARGELEEHSCGTAVCMAGAFLAFNDRGRFGAMTDALHGHMEEHGEIECEAPWDWVLGAVVDSIPPESNPATSVLARYKTYDTLLNPCGVNLDAVEPQHAARVLRYFLETGEVDWGKAGLDS